MSPLLDALAVLRLARVVASCFLVAFASCGPPLPLEVGFKGCAEVLAPAEAPTCIPELTDPVIEVWAKPPPDGQLSLVAGTVPVAAPKRTPEGYLWRVALEPSVDEVVVRARVGSRSKRWRLPVVWREVSVDLGEPNLVLGGAQGKEARTRARARLRELASQANDDFTRGTLLKRMAELEREVDPARASELFSEAVELLAQEGRIRSQIEAMLLHHHVLFANLQDHRAAGQVLNDLPAAPSGDVTSELNVAIVLAPWNSRLGRFQQALRELREAEEKAERFDHPLQIYTKLYQLYPESQLGLFEEARDNIVWLRKNFAELAIPCRQSDFFTDLGWSQLLILEGGGKADPVQDLQEALDLATDCGELQRANIAINLALAYLHQGSLEAAQDALELAMREVPSPPGWLREWRWVVEGRIALALNRPAAALEPFQALEAYAESRLLFGSRWRAAVGKGRALEALGKTEQALASYRKADDLLDSSGLEVESSYSHEPESSWAFFERGTRFHLDLLVKAGKRQEALQLARSSRRRALRHLATRARLEALTGDALTEWSQLQGRYDLLRGEVEKLLEEERKVPLDGLEEIEARRRVLAGRQREIVDEVLEFLSFNGNPGDRLVQPFEPRPGEVTLVYHPLPLGWAGFAVDEKGIQVEVLDFEDPRPASPEDLSSHLLEPFREAIGRARRVRILPYGPLWQVDFQTLPMAAGILLESHPVVYGLDLPGAQHRRPLAGGRALLVEDPTGSLVHARREILSLKQSLESQGLWQVSTLSGASVNAATLRSFWDREAVDLFHFAGHAEVENRGGQEAGLLLAKGSRLTIDDILTRERAPGTVVLSACSVVGVDTGRASVGMGLAQAFLLAGSREVIGPTGPIDDSTAAALIELFYERWPGEAAPEALRQAQLILWERGGFSTGPLFRLVER
ncbi:MAG: CHAT domain-containing protein [Deltaproteobacteria bacterium]|nr:CHAT domain-containing protein [Deltaproteobacteria bacterium]